MSALRLCLLGVPEVWHDDVIVTIRTRKALALLAYLAIDGGLHTREQLSELLWPDHTTAEARANLRSTLRHLRAALGHLAQEVLQSDRDTMGLVPSALIVLDTQILAEARRLAQADAKSRELRGQLERAVSLYKGPFLADLSISDAPDYDAWLAAQRANWLAAATTVLEGLAELQVADGDAEAAQTSLERWVSLDPGDETGWQRLLELHLERRDPAAARRVWLACRQALAELEVTPGTVLQALGARVEASVASGAGTRPPVIHPDRVSEEISQATLVGRSHEMALLQQILERARAGKTEVAILEGETGIGKTRVAREFLAWAETQGVDALIGRCFETRGDLPYAPIAEALRDRLEQENAPEDLLEDLWLAELSRLLPELRTRYPDLPTVTADPVLGRNRLYEAVARVGHAFSSRRPYVIFLDDIQWSDPGTRDMTRYVVGRRVHNNDAVFLIMAVRLEDLESDPGLALWLESFGSVARVTRLRLEHLNPSDVTRWLASLTGKATPHVEADEGTAIFGGWLATKTGGQPFYMVQTLSALLDDGILGLRATEGGWSVEISGALSPGAIQRLDSFIPTGMRALIQVRLARLDETTRDLLLAGAVLGSQFTEQQLFQVADVAERVGVSALELLVRMRLLCEECEPGAYSFAHDMLRTVVYAEAGSARRRSFHRRALELLKQERAPTATLARHAVAGGLPEEGVRYSILAGDEALAAAAIDGAVAS